MLWQLFDCYWSNGGFVPIHRGYINAQDGKLLWLKWGDIRGWCLWGFYYGHYNKGDTQTYQHEKVIQ